MSLYLHSFFHRLSLRVSLSWFGVLLLILLLLVSCQKTYMIINHAEIRRGYMSGELEYIPSLKRVVEEENRDLANHAMFQLGNIYYRLITGKSYFNYNDEAEVEKNIVGLEEFFVSNLNVTTDFNLKNHIYRNLIFSSRSQTEDIYLEVVGDIPAGSENGSLGQNGKIENVIAVLKLAGKRLYYHPESNIDTLIEVCTTGFMSDNKRARTGGVECLRDLKVSVMKADLADQEITELAKSVDRAGMALVSGLGVGFYEKYLATRLMGITNDK